MLAELVAQQCANEGHSPLKAAEPTAQPHPVPPAKVRAGQSTAYRRRNSVHRQAERKEPHRKHNITSEQHMQPVQSLCGGYFKVSMAQTFLHWGQCHASACWVQVSLMVFPFFLKMLAIPFF
jgi:hypothetical protein